MHLRPEEVVQFVIETTFGPPPSEVGREIEQNPELRASFERAQADIQAGRVSSQDEILEWHRNYPR